jgi:hypothetical protein
MNVTLYQISYKPEHFTNPLPGTTVWDNTKGDPQMREYSAFLQEFKNRADGINEYWGMVSPKFFEKTRVSPEKFVKWIKDNPGRHVYFINPCPINECLYANVVEHGERFHKGITDIFQCGLGYDPNNMKMARNKFAFCNFFVGDYFFWSRYLRFVEGFLLNCAKDTRIREMLYKGDANYSYDKSLPYLPFVIERLFSTFLWDKGEWAAAYEFTYDEQAHKMPFQIFEEMNAISTVKQGAVSYDDPSHGDTTLWNTWETLRNYFVYRNPYLLNVE